MLTKDVLNQAKAFLCWDKYPDLSIKLIAIDEAVAFFYPPTNDLATIVVFYEKSSNDFSHAFFYLFHEVGHLIQNKKYRGKDFQEFINLDRGTRKIEFEKEAWALGKDVLKEFIEKYQLQKNDLVLQYDRFAHKCLMSYN